VFVDLYQMQQRTRAIAEERVAFAKAEAARFAAEETSRRSSFLAPREPRARGFAAPRGRQ